MCKSGWGDVGCSAQLRVLQSGVSHHETDLDVRHWRHFEFEVCILYSSFGLRKALLLVKVPKNAEGFFVELLRVSGDPILFAKAAINFKGAETELPSVMDYPSYADSESLEAMSSRHFITKRTRRHKRFYISVYNNPGRLRESASFILKAKVIDSPSNCPFQCSNHGDCVPTRNSHAVQCQCHEGPTLAATPLALETHALRYCGETVRDSCFRYPD